MNNLLHAARWQWLTALLMVAGGCWQVAHAQNTYVEYFWNSDPGVGQATRSKVSLGKNANVNISTDDIPYGLNVLGLRAVHSGVASPTTLRNIYKVNFTTEIPANYVEYFVDHDPGVGKAERIAAEPDDEGNVFLDISDVLLHEGVNNLGLRLLSHYSDRQTASPVTFRHVYKYPSRNQHWCGVEYFINTDPGIGKAKVSRPDVIDYTPGGYREDVELIINEPAIIVKDHSGAIPNDAEIDTNHFAPRRQSASTAEEFTFDIPVEELREGVNVLGLRTIGYVDGHYTYSPTTYRYVYLPANAEQVNVDYLEYFWDTDPGLGLGHSMEITPGVIVELENYDIDFKGIYGTHTLYVRARAGQTWVTTSHEVTLPILPMTGNVQLNWQLSNDPENNVYQTIGAFVGDLYSRGISAGLTVDVADGTYYCEMTEQMLPVVEKVAETLEKLGLFFEMKAPTQATLCFVMSEDFIMTHEEELMTIAGYVQTLFSHVVTTNITLLLNEDIYKYEGFQVEPNDLLALKNFYNRLGGTAWTPKQWSFQSNGRKREDFPGVTFDEAGCVIRIELSENNVKGKLGDWNLYLPQLQVLYLDGNDLTGDITPFVKELANLRSLRVQNNLLTELSDWLPSSLVSFNAENQNIKFDQENWDESYADMSALKPAVVYMSNEATLELPSLFTFVFKKNGKSRSYPQYIGVFASGNNLSEQWASLEHLDDDMDENLYRYHYLEWYLNYDYRKEQDAPAVLRVYADSIAGTAYPAVVRWVPGDADISGYTDVLDVQYTLAHILNALEMRPFNYSAANTYADNVINVQDIVNTVNLVLANEAEEEAPVKAARLQARRRMERVPARAWLYAHGEHLALSAADEVAAMDIELAGVTTDQVSLQLNRQDFQMQGRNTRRGSRYVIFSPTGKTVPIGTTDVLAVSGTVEPVTVQLADVQAHEVRALLNQQPTGVLTPQIITLTARFDGSLLVVTSSSLCENARIHLTAANGSVMRSEQLTLLQGDTHIEAALPAGAYILEVVTSQGERHIVKLMKK